MVKYLYEDFLTDETQYLACEKFWSDLCDNVVERYSAARDWKPFSSKTFVDGTPIRDGNVHHDFVSESTQKGIVVIQLPPGELQRDITSYTDTFGGDPGEEGTWDHLVIHCELSEESAEVARQLLIEWVQYEGPHKDFQPTIDRILGW